MKVVKVSHAVSSPAEEKSSSVKNKILSLGNRRGFFVSAFHRASHAHFTTQNLSG
jgi:hypothetical protein